MKRAAILLLYLTLAVSCGSPAAAVQAPPVTPLAPDSLRTWLTAISSDEFEGRATFSPGLDKAAAYIADRLKEAGVRPGGDEGSYLQKVEVLTVQSTNQSTLTVEVNGVSRTFRNGEDVFFQPDVGGKRTLTLNDVEFVGYGLHIRSIHDDYAGRDVRKKAVVWLGDGVPATVVDLPGAGRFLEARASTALEEMGAAASLTLSPRFRGRRFGSSTFVTTERLDSPRPPEVAVSDDVLGFIFSASGLNYEEIKGHAALLENLPPATIKGVKLIFNLDADYRVTNTRTTQNVVGFIDGSDPQLKSTYVAFGAHYDHLGIDEDLRTTADEDRINNGADDDGSGTTALIGLANAFMKGSRPRRSIMLAWHAGEERGLWGSKYLADHPPVPIDSIVAQLNIDMIGRNRDNLDSEENTVYAVGADRISTELHNLLVDANASMSVPLKIDFEMNDSADPERIYFRSDHFSYAAKGIPIIFFFTGLHPDYHQVTDSVEKIHFDKLSHITNLVYQLGLRLGNLDHAPVRDFKGPRTGRGFSGKLITDNN